MCMKMMIMMTVKKKIKLLKHKLGFHNERCRRRVFTTKNSYLCLITGNKFKRRIYELFRVFKKK